MPLDQQRRYIRAALQERQAQRDADQQARAAEAETNAPEAAEATDAEAEVPDQG